MKHIHSSGVSTFIELVKANFSFLANGRTLGCVMSVISRAARVLTVLKRRNKSYHHDHLTVHD